MWVRSLGWEDSLEEGITTHPSIFAWRIPWTEEPGGLQSMGSQRLTWQKRLNTHRRELYRPEGGRRQKTPPHPPTQAGSPEHWGSCLCSSLVSPSPSLSAGQSHGRTQDCRRKKSDRWNGVGGQAPLGRQCGGHFCQTWSCTSARQEAPDVGGWESRKTGIPGHQQEHD